MKPQRFNPLGNAGGRIKGLRYISPRCPLCDTQGAFGMIPSPITPGDVFTRTLPCLHCETLITIRTSVDPRTGNTIAEFYSAEIPF